MPHVSKCHYCHSTAVVNSLWKCTQGVCMCVCWCFVYANKVIRLFNFHARVLPEMSSLGRHQHWNLVPVMRTYTDDDRRCVLSECKQCTNKTSDVAAAAAGLFGLWMFTCLLWFPSQSVRKMDDWGTNEKKKMMVKKWQQESTIVYTHGCFDGVQEQTSWAVLLCTFFIKIFIIANTFLSSVRTRKLGNMLKANPSNSFPTHKKLDFPKNGEVSELWCLQKSCYKWKGQL